MGEWFEDDRFWTEYAPLMFDDSRWGQASSEVEAIVSLCGLKPGARVLDICCGVGRHSVEFARRGYRVTGIDITQPYLEAARSTAEGIEPGPEFIHADARSFSRPSQYDACVNLYTSFGYFSSEEDDLAMLRLCASNLVPGGAFVLETLGKEVEARDFVKGEEFDRSGWHVRTEFSIVGAWEGLVNRWILDNGSERIDHSFTLRLYSGHELKRLLGMAGFRDISVYGGFDGRPYDENAATLVALARR